MEEGNGIPNVRIRIGSFSTIVFMTVVSMVLLESLGSLITDGAIKFFGNLMLWIVAGFLIGMGVVKLCGMWVQDVRLPIIEAENQAPVRRVSTRKKKDV